eukprot:TRINITY_DN0_c3523_g1_i2.p1 TRINITY_DN0_c3523_g1~~TRINITY_DN0_c3523_g1_i2.p1  ORF type:complete len:200 (+),score=38.38 TRINITY_DN0_c3523_g1_i2:117-716(+)
MALKEKIEKGGHKRVVLTAAASTLAKQLRQLCANKFEFVNIVRRPELVEELKREGDNDIVLDSSALDFEQALTSQLHNWNATLLLDAVGGPELGRLLHRLAPGGKAVLYGSLSYKNVGDINPLDIIFEGKTIEGFYLHKWLQSKAEDKSIDQLKKEWNSLMVEGNFDTQIAKTIPLEQIAAAVKEYNLNMSAGKILIKP